MAFITYVLVAGLALGTQDRFSPDLLGLQASSALAWLTVEVLAILLSLYLITVNTDLSTIDLVAFLGYKYVGMIGGVLMGLLFGKIGYYLVLGWCCVSIFVFMIRTLRLKILAEAAAEGIPVRGARNQLRMYLTMAVAAARPAHVLAHLSPGAVRAALRRLLPLLLPAAAAPHPHRRCRHSSSPGHLPAIGAPRSPCPSHPPRPRRGAEISSCTGRPQQGGHCSRNNKP